VVPSRLATTPPEVAAAQPVPTAPQPRRAEREVVGGKPVFVVYRPSRGIEVREDRDTDRAVR
jgi:hypothetical protein